VVIACTFRHSWTAGWEPVGVGVGLGDVGVGLEDGLGVVFDGLGEGLVDGSAEALLVGLGEELVLVLDVVGVGVLLAVAVAVELVLEVAVAVELVLEVAVAVELVLEVAVAVELVLDVAVAVGLGLAVGLELALDVGLAVLRLGWGVDRAAVRTIRPCPAGTVRTAALVAGGCPHTLEAELAALAWVWLPTTRSPLTMPDERSVTLATIRSANEPARAVLMAAPSSPWSSWWRPRVSSRLCLVTPGFAVRPRLFPPACVQHLRMWDRKRTCAPRPVRPWTEL
jgi:hypothetical protein